MKTLYLDMDGVMVNFVDPLLTLFNSKLTHDEINDWEICPQMGITTEQFWHGINCAGPQWWSSLPDYPWSKDLFDHVSKKCRVTYLSSPGLGIHAKDGKREWLKRWHARDMDAIFDEQKYRYAFKDAILLDDRGSHCESFIAHGGQAILFPQPWNEARHKLPNRLPYVFSRLEQLAS